MGEEDDAVPMCSLMSLTPTEQSLLVGSAAVEQTPGQREAWMHAASVADWAPTFNAALDNGTLALVCWHLQALPEDALAPELREAAQTFLNQQRKMVEAGLAQWRDVLGALEREGIQVIPYKGPVSASAYGDQPWLRSFRDLDVLVREPDFDGAIDCLEAMGYQSDGVSIDGWQRKAIRRRARQETLYSSGLAVEPHCGFAQRSLGLELKVDDVFARARAGQMHGRDVLVMAPEDTFLVLALHGGKERWQRLIWVVDVAEHLKGHPGFDWDFALHRARACGLERCALLSLLLVHDLLGAPVPAHYILQARGNRVCVGLAAQVEAALATAGSSAGWAEVKRFQSRLLERPRDWCRAFFESVVDIRQEDYAALSLPRPFAVGFVGVKAARRGAQILAAWRGRES
ncbi:MAG: hypothetical protein JWM36_1882 [Hyphomicrobiales bacterium]|nr:hypothetical protein [Hyphomicrobiales bacterium]